MAELNEKQGTIIAHCPRCNGSRSTFEWRRNGNDLGAILEKVDTSSGPSSSRQCVYRTYRLFQCGGCGGGALGLVRFGPGSTYPSSYSFLEWFIPEVKERMPVPKDTPSDLTAEFREAEKCLENQCYRAAAGLFRSVLDKTLLANGYKPKRENLKAQIDAAANDGVIAEARRTRAHQDIRVLGNDVLHDKWREIKEEDVELAHRYSQRILEDFYDDRESVLSQLRKKGRVPDEDRDPIAPDDNEKS
jgi:Domain of unknown function (DUF4145)